MPKTWDVTAEAKLMAAIFSICDVKVSVPQLKKLAEIMGSDCTPKAISHRITKLRKAGGGNSDAGAKDGGEPKTKKTKTAAASVKQGGRRRAEKRVATPVESDDEEDATQPTPPTTVDRPQRSRGAKRNYDETNIKEEAVNSEHEDDGDDGIKVGEDIGQGLRATRPDYRSEADDSDLTLPSEA